MEKQFVPYELALKLKGLGFDEECFKYWGSEGVLNQKWNLGNTVEAPLWQQAFDWFAKEYGLFAKFNMHTRCGWTIGLLPNCKLLTNSFDKELYNEKSYNNYEEAKLACLLKLIEIVELKTNQP